MEFDVKVWKVTFRVIVQGRTVLICDINTGGILWCLRVEIDSFSEKLKLVTGHTSPKEEIKYFEEELRSKCLVIYKKQLKNDKKRS